MGHVYVKKTRDLPSIMLPDHLSEQEIIDLLTEQPSSYRGAVTHGQRSDTQSLTGEGHEQGTSAASQVTVMHPPVTVATVTPAHNTVVTAAEVKSHSEPATGDVQAPPKTSVGAVSETGVTNTAMHTEGTHSAPVSDMDKRTEEPSPLAAGKHVVLDQPQSGGDDDSETLYKDPQVENRAKPAKDKDVGAEGSDARLRQDRPCDSMSDMSSSPGGNVPLRKSKRNRNKKCK